MSAIEAPYNASDPYATFLNSSCMDLLLIELVPMAFRLADEVSVKQTAGASGNSYGNTSNNADEDEKRDAAFRKLEALGYRVGQGMVER